VSTTDSSSEISTLIPNTEQTEPVLEVEAKDSMIGFFAIGLVINLVMITAFFIWARKQWKKPSKVDE
jgi:hypothetical protein